MSSQETIDVLNGVLAIVCRSFPQYLRYAHPYINSGSNERLKETLGDIVAAQDTLAERITQLIDSAGGLPDDGEFPMEFTGSHDLDIDYAIREAIGYQRQDIAELEKSAESLNLAPAAQSLVEEALGTARGHLESLEELVQEDNPVSSRA